MNVNGISNFALQAAKEDDKETLKLLDNPALFIHSLIKQRLLLVSSLALRILKKGYAFSHHLLQRSENCKTALEDLDDLSDSSEAAYKRSHDIHWTSRPKTANTNVVGVRERTNTAPASLGSQWPSDVKQLKVFFRLPSLNKRSHQFIEPDSTYKTLMKC